MVYTPPTRAALRDSIARDLRDPEFKTFATADIDDFINFGIAEVNRVYPLEAVDEVVVEDITVITYATLMTHIWRVEVWRSGKYGWRISPNEGDNSRGGWELYAQELRIPLYSNSLNADTDVFRIWGYVDRDALVDDADVLEGDLDAEAGVRSYSAQQGLSRLANDRTLFQQWQTQSNNSDVSPTQLNGMFAMRAGEWDTLRNRIRRLRRSA